MLVVVVGFFFACAADHRELHVLTPSCPTLRSSVLRRRGKSRRVGGRSAGGSGKGRSRGGRRDNGRRHGRIEHGGLRGPCRPGRPRLRFPPRIDGKSTRLNSSH